MQVHLAYSLVQTRTDDTNLLAGQCGWTNDISYYGDDENTEFDALQVTLAKELHARALP